MQTILWFELTISGILADVNIAILHFNYFLCIKVVKTGHNSTIPILSASIIRAFKLFLLIYTSMISLRYIK